MKEGKITIDITIPFDGLDIPVPMEIIYHAQSADPHAGWGPHIIVDVINYPNCAEFYEAVKKVIKYPSYLFFEKAMLAAASEIKAACEAAAKEG